MRTISESFEGKPCIYLSYHMEGEQKVYTLFVSIALREEQSFSIPDNPSAAGNSDVFELSISGEAISSSDLLMKTGVHTGIMATHDTIEVVADDGLKPRKAKMRYADADKGGVGG